MHPTPHTRPHIPIGLLLAGAIVVLVPIGGIVGWLIWQWYTLQMRYPIAADAIRIGLFVGAPVFVGALVWQRWGRTRYIDAHHITQQIRARVQVAPMAAHYHHEVNAVAGEAVPALPAPIAVTKSTADWMQWADAQPHCLIAGRTKSGKTHTACAILAQRLRAGETCKVIDPHSSDWLGLPTVGFVGIKPDGKPDTSALNDALMTVAKEFMSRMQKRDDHKAATGGELPHTHWPRLTILIDEANYIADVLPTVWREVVRALSSGGRKVGISLLVIGQSPLVEDIQISGGMRANFARIGLDDRSIQQLISIDEKDNERKKALNAALVGLKFPAAATIDSQVWLLDRDGLSAGSVPASVKAFAVGDTLAGGNERSIAVTSPEADSSNVPIVPTAAEIATIAARLGSGTPSEVAKTLDGYHPRRYGEFKAKVEYVQALLKGETQ